MRSAASTHFLFGAFMWPLVALWVYIAVTKSASGWQAVAVIATAALVWHLYFGYLQLTVAHDVLTYRTLFSRRSVPLLSVVRSELQGNENRRDIRVFLAIVPDVGEPIRVNLKPFRRDDIRQLLELPDLRFGRGHDVA
jgi:hypothetical protein